MLVLLNFSKETVNLNLSAEELPMTVPTDSICNMASEAGETGSKHLLRPYEAKTVVWNH